MAPNLAASQHALIRDMILSRRLKQTEIAAVAGCSDRTVRNIATNLGLFGKTKAPSNGAGRRRRITPQMLDALRERLLEKPGMYQDEMAVFLYDEFSVLVNTASISRALASIKWSKKASRHIAKQRNAELRDFYLHNLSDFCSYRLVYVDESGCDKRIGFRRTGWSPLGVTPVQVTKLHRDRRYQILPAYTQDGILHSRVFQGTTDSAAFEDFIAQLLCHCGRWPEPKSVLIMDNASIHRSWLTFSPDTEVDQRHHYLYPGEKPDKRMAFYRPSRKLERKSSLQSFRPSQRASRSSRSSTERWGDYHHHAPLPYSPRPMQQIQEQPFTAPYPPAQPIAQPFHPPRQIPVPSMQQPPMMTQPTSRINNATGNVEVIEFPNGGPEDDIEMHDPHMGGTRYRPRNDRYGPTAPMPINMRPCYGQSRYGGRARSTCSDDSNQKSMRRLHDPRGARTPNSFASGDSFGEFGGHNHPRLW